MIKENLINQKVINHKVIVQHLKKFKTLKSLLLNFGIQRKVNKSQKLKKMMERPQMQVLKLLRKIKITMRIKLKSLRLQNKPLDLQTDYYYYRNLEK
jgi:hypothetical protein